MAWHSFIVIFNLYLGVKHSRFYGRLIHYSATSAYAAAAVVVTTVLHIEEWYVETEYVVSLCSAQMNTFLFEEFVNRFHSCRTHTHTHQVKEIPREHDRKNKMRLLANKNDIKMWARQPWPILNWKLNNEMASISR